ncbi:hypothetical protein SLEP1_g24122 [Rubroshorea leprosula]|uniref:Uncharacterized protein n=1 Tax=Rubroshorea leprosula TaxID=152421 RepID=A0AAV5JKJ7_9ROSI|nr:hypothetical protein SLEP1_g24122 [Rubroshorea leprosula]
MKGVRSGFAFAETKDWKPQTEATCEQQVPDFWLRYEEAVVESSMAEIGDKGSEAADGGHERAAGSRFLAEIGYGKAGGGDWCVVLVVVRWCCSSPAFFCF